MITYNLSLIESESLMFLSLELLDIKFGIFSSIPNILIDIDTLGDNWTVLQKYIYIYIDCGLRLGASKQCHA